MKNKRPDITEHSRLMTFFWNLDEDRCDFFLDYRITEYEVINPKTKEVLDYEEFYWN